MTILSSIYHFARRRVEALHLIEHDEVALEAAARADEIGKAQQERQRNPPPLSTAQLPGHTHMQSAANTASVTVLSWSLCTLHCVPQLTHPLDSQRRVRLQQVAGLLSAGHMPGIVSRPGASQHCSGAAWEGGL